MLVLGSRKRADQGPCNVHAASQRMNAVESSQISGLWGSAQGAWLAGWRKRGFIFLLFFFFSLSMFLMYECMYVPPPPPPPPVDPPKPHPPDSHVCR